MEGDAGTSRLTPMADDLTTETDELASLAEEPTCTDEAAAQHDAHPARSRLYSRGWVIAACATLLGLTVLVAGGGYLVARANQQGAAVTRAEAAAVKAAKDCVTATQAPDVAAMAASQQKILECATGDFGAQANLYSGVLVDVYQAANAKVQVSNIRAAVEQHHEDGSMDVLVALRVKITNSTVQDQESGYRLRVNMAPDGGTYKIAKLDQVTK
jgi:Mce-associated membrane protein